jgi:predicted lipid-binding transport protein (Tim44 family)
MQDNFGLSIIVLIALAAFVGWRLYSVLGLRGDADDGHSPAPLKRSLKLVSTQDSAAHPEAPADHLEDNPSPAPSAVSRDPDRWRGIAPHDSDLARALDALVAAEPSFDVRLFLTNAKAAYELIVMAFAAGDRTTLRDLLSRDVFDSFAAAISEREKRGDTVETTFVGIESAVLQSVELKGQAAQLTAQFVSHLITVTKDKSGQIIEGAPDKVVDVTDMWTFAREIGSRDPVWRLIATEAAH